MSWVWFGLVIKATMGDFEAEKIPEYLMRGQERWDLKIGLVVGCTYTPLCECMYPFCFLLYLQLFVINTNLHAFLWAFLHFLPFSCAGSRTSLLYGVMLASFFHQIIFWKWFYVQNLRRQQSRSLKVAFRISCGKAYQKEEVVIWSIGVLFLFQLGDY